MKKASIVFFIISVMCINAQADHWEKLWEAAERDSLGTYFEGALQLYCAAAYPDIVTKRNARDSSLYYYVTTVDANDFSLLWQIDDHLDLNFNYYGEIRITAYTKDKEQLSGFYKKLGYSDDHDYAASYTIPGTAAKLVISAIIHKDDFWNNANDERECLKYVCTLYIDKTSPVIAITKPIPDDTQTIPLQDKKWYAASATDYYSSKPLTFAARCTDAGSGIGNLHITTKDGSTILMQNIAYTNNADVILGEEDKQYSVIFSAIDRLNQAAASTVAVNGRSRFYVDASPPTLPPQVNIRYRVTDTGYGFKAVTHLELSWDPVKDGPVKYNSGVNGYYHSLLKYNDDGYIPDPGHGDPFTKGSMPPPALPTPLVQSYSFPSADIVPAAKYSFGVTAADKLYNFPKDAAGNYLWRAADIYTAPADVKILAVEYGTPGIAAAGGEKSAVYPVDVYVNQTMAVLDYVASLGISCYEDIAGQSRVYTLLGDTGWETAQYTDRNGYTTGCIKLHAVLTTDAANRSKHAHKMYTFVPVLTHKYTDQHGAAFRTLGANAITAQVPNLTHFQAMLAAPQAGIPGYSITVDREGYNAATGEPIALNVNTPVQIGFNNAEIYDNGSCWQDYEGDRLGIQLYTINLTPLTNPVQYSDVQEASFNLVYEQRVHCFLRITENNDNGFFNRTDTLHANNTAGFIITRDTNAPAGKFCFTDNGQVLDDTHPANRNDIQVQIAKTDFSADADTVYLWNVNTDNLINISDMTGIDLGPLAPTTFTPEQTIHFADYPGNIFYTDWHLSGDETESGIRMVAMKIGEGNNTAYIKQTINLDVDPPAPITALSCTQGTGKITLNWTDAANSAVKYMVRYRQGGDQDFLEIKDIPVKYQDIGIAAMGYNAEIDVKVYAVDSAGNRSFPYPADPDYYKLYTPAYIGDTTDLTISQGYTKTAAAYTRYIQWEIPGGVAAAREVETAPPGNYALTITEEENSCLYRLSGVQSRTRYTLTVKACNTGGDTVEEVLTYTMENYPPAMAAPVKPVLYATEDNILFSWQEAEDGDEDQLTYTVKLKKAGDAEYQTLAATTATTFTFNSTDPLLPAVFTGHYFSHNADYQWYVETDDTHSITEGIPAQFKVDASVPVIAYVDPPAGFTNRETAEVSIYPGTSGLDTANCGYTATDGITGSMKNITYDTDHYTATVDLHSSDTPYNITVYAANRAGRGTTATCNNLTVDWDDPQITELIPELHCVENIYYSKTKEIPVTIKTSDNFAGAKALEYGFITAKTDEVGAARIVPLTTTPGTAGETTHTVRVNAEAANGAAQYLAVRAEDWAGNKGGFEVLGDPLLFDYTQPEITEEITGYNYHKTARYMRSLEQLTVNTWAIDRESGIKNLDFGLKQEGTETVTWYAAWDEVKTNAPALDNGAEYRIITRAENRAGNITEQASVPMQYDNTAPVNLGLIYKTGAPYLAGETAHITVHAEDPETGIAGYRLALGDAGDECALSASLAGNIDGWLTQEDAEFVFTMPDVKGAYIIRCEAVNAAGLATRDAVSYPLTLTDCDEQILVEDNGPYQTMTDRFHAQWKYTGTEALKGYKYRITGPGYENSTWQPEGGEEYSQQTDITLENLNLTPGGMYLCEVKAYYAYTMMGAITGTSRGVTVDPTAPVFTAVSIPEAFHADNLVVSWNIGESESGVKNVEMLLERCDAENTKQVIGGSWITLPALASGTCKIRMDNNGRTLRFTDGERIYMTFRAANGADLTVTKGTPGSIYDNSKPPVPVVTDQGNAIRLQQITDNGLECSWIWTHADPESGMAGYWWSPVVFDATANPDIAHLPADNNYLESLTWQQADTTKTVRWTGPGLPAHGQVCYFFVKAVNRAGLVSAGVSNGIVADNTGPWVSGVKLITGENTAEPDKRYVNSTDNLRLHISTVEPESGVDYYQVYYGAMSGGVFTPAAETYVSAGTPVRLGDTADTYPDLAEGTVIYFQGQCVNEAGLGSTVGEYGYTQGVMLDLQLPVVEFKSSSCIKTELFFDWEGVSLYSPIRGYMLELWRMIPGTGTRETMAARWERYTDNALTIDTVAYNNNPLLPPGMELTDGTYCLYIRAENEAGNVSVEKTSPAVILDTTAPVLTISTYTSDPGGIYAGNWIELAYHVTDDPYPGSITEYRYQAGTAEDPDKYSGAWVSILTTQSNLSVRIDFTDFVGGWDSVPEGTEIIITAKVFDKAGNESNTAVSLSMIADKSRAGITALELDNHYIASASIVYGLSFTLTDAVSGILEYRSIIVADNNPETLLPFMDAPGAWHTVQAPGKPHTLIIEDYAAPANGNLIPGNSYYVVLQVTDRVGFESLPVYSEEIIIDMDNPAITFSQGDNGVKKASGFVFNASPFSFRYELNDAVSPDVKVKLALFYGSGLPVIGENGIPVELVNDWKVTDNATSSGYPFNATDYQTYILTAALEDRAGNKTTVQEHLRVNRPPAIAFGDYFDTTSLKPFVLSAIVDDPDDEEQNFTYQWQLPDYTHDYPEFAQLQDDAAPVVKIKHRTPLSQLSEYAVQLQVTDSDGKLSETVETKIYVRNTVKGALYDNEYWAPAGGAVYMLLDTVIVPQQFALTIAEGTKVEVAADMTADGYALVIQGTVEIKTGAELCMESAAPDLYWKGVSLEDGSSSTVNGAVIRNAERGLTVNAGVNALTLSNTTFDGNKVGIHVLKNGQAITACMFTHSYYYGVKEDEGACPVLLGCTFADNAIDYYDGADTATTADELDAAGRN